MLCPYCKTPMIRVRSTPLEDEYRCKDPKCNYSLTRYLNGEEKQNHSKDLSGSQT